MRASLLRQAKICDKVCEYSIQSRRFDISHEFSVLEKRVSGDWLDQVHLDD